MDIFLSGYPNKCEALNVTNNILLFHLITQLALLEAEVKHLGVTLKME